MAATIRWSPYSDLTNPTTLNIYNGMLNTQNTQSAYCTGFTFLVNEEILLDHYPNTRTVNFNNPKWGISNNNNNDGYSFYAMGARFNKAVLLAQRDQLTVISPSDLSLNTGTIRLLGVYRPSIDMISTDGFINKVGFTCAPSVTDYTSMLTNYYYNIGQGNSVMNFIVDFNPSSVFWSNPSVVPDINQIFKDDTAGNLVILLNPPTAIPNGSVFNFSISQDSITTNTICGLAQSNQPAVECQSELQTQAFSCPTPIGGSSFEICCYNIAIKTDQITIDTLSINFPIPQNIIGLNLFVSQTVYNANAMTSQIPNPYLFSTNYANLPDFLNTNYATITAVNYQYVTQVSGIGIAIFTINLPRRLVRGMKVIVTGNFSAMALSNVNPRCVATFSQLANDMPNTPQIFNSSPEEGDILLDSCSTTNFATSSNQIYVITKNIIYKCGQSFSNIINIMVWPVTQVDFSTIKTASYQVQMVTTTTNNALAYNNYNFQMPNSTQSLNKAPLLQLYNTIAQMSLGASYQAIPAGLADYVFNFNLTNVPQLFPKVTISINEISFFFPYDLYGAEIDNLQCMHNNDLINCSFDFEGIMNIRYPINLDLTTAFVITLQGVRNPIISTVNNIVFPISLNQADFASGTRQNVIVGSAKFNGGVNLDNVMTNNTGGLRFYNLTVDNINPREVSNHTFTVGFNTGVDLTTIPSLIAGMLITIDFPPEYQLNWFNSTVTSYITQYDLSSAFTVDFTREVPIVNTTRSGNKVIITLGDTYFNNTFQYYDISLAGINNPNDEIITGGYYVTFTNPGITSIYRTYTNMNTFIGVPLQNPADPWLSYGRGNNFVFDDSKWVIDVISPNNPPNTLVVRAGRYTVASFMIQQDNLLNQAITTVSLVDNRFQTSQASYNLSTSINQPLNFLIGVPCDTMTGIYLIRFQSSDNQNFTLFAPVEVYVDHTPGTITYAFTDTPAVTLGGSAYVPIQLSEPNFDPLVLNWIPAGTTDSGSSISNITVNPAQGIPPDDMSQVQALNNIIAEVTISSYSVSIQNQIFIGQNPNTCYTWGVNGTVNFNVYGTPQNPSQIDLTPYFAFYNADSDPTLSKNSIRFSFTPPTAPIYIFAALVCGTENIPPDSEIINPVLPESPFLKFHTDYYQYKIPQDIIFNGLMRGKQYKLRVVLKSVQADPTQRYTSTITLEKLPDSDGIHTDYFLPVLPRPTRCLEFNLTNDFDMNSKIALVNYCQKIFSENGFYKNGCVICSDLNLQIFAPGINFPNTQCPSYNSNTTTPTPLRFLQNATNTTNSTLNSSLSANVTLPPQPTIFSVCALSSPFCDNDGLSSPNIDDIMGSLLQDLDTQIELESLLNLPQNVQLNSATIVSDLNTPSMDDVVVNFIGNNNITVSWSMYNTEENTLRCNWMITSQRGTPSFAAIRGCLDTKLCGINIIDKNIRVVSADSSALLYSTTYYIFYTCYNLLPYAQHLTPVTLISTFTTSPAPYLTQPVDIDLPNRMLNSKEGFLTSKN
jgi:hypothetical protein